MKTKVYSWRLSSELKRDLERAARDEGVPISRVLERLTQDWLAQRRSEDEAEQARIRARLAKLIGVIHGTNPRRSQNVRQIVGEGIARKYGR